jgi:hypothetical protein
MAPNSCKLDLRFLKNGRLRQTLLLVLGCSVLPGPLAAAPKVRSSTSSSQRPNARTPERPNAEYLGTPATERAVERALKYLQKAQNSDGSWDSSTYTAEVGITGLCSLAFLSAGHQPGRGPFGRALTRATDFLADKVQRTGLIYNAAGSPGPPMYGHGFATLALAELYGQSKRRDLRDKLERAVKLILTTQNEEGGWRYQPRVADADISVSVCQVMALRAAHNAGIPVPRDVVKRAIDYMKECANNSDGGFSYMPSQRVSGPARTGAGILSLLLSGERKAPEVQRGLQYLMEHPPGTREQHLFYGVYYNTQAMYQAGGAYWRFWFPRLASYLLDTQRQDGSWWDGPGAPYATAMGTLALQVPAHLLPIYQR